MRLTCPNCGAQYEVPDEVIPFDGRDVQCSNCGDTWFQGHPDNPDTQPEPENDSDQEAVAQKPETAAEPEGTAEPAPEVEPETKPEIEPEGEPEPEGEAEPEGEPKAEPEPQAEPEADAEIEPDVARDPPEPDPPEPDPQTGAPGDEAPEPPRSQPDIDSGITDILRQEAEREAQLRAAETADPLESQPDLGLDTVGDAPTQRASEARSRMARMRGQSPDPVSDAGSRRELLPDIEEINSAWSASGDAANPGTEIGPALAEQARKQRSGFARGFGLIVIIGIILALIYANAPRLAQAVPMAEPALTSYVNMVDQARIWLDVKLQDLTPDP